MRPIVLDTNAYTAYKRADAKMLEIIQSVEVIGISPIVLGELYFGFDGGNKSKQNRQELHQFLESPRVILYSITSDTAHFYSQIHSSLRRKGKPIPTNDIWIAALALEHGGVVCTYDKHFTEIEGLMVASSVFDLVI
jgi:tRNA(fMet)-specific endonuclease VapC